MQVAGVAGNTPIKVCDFSHPNSKLFCNITLLVCFIHFFAKAYLLSNTITPNSDQCVEFYFYNEYKSYGQLNLYINHVTSTRKEGVNKTESAGQFNSKMLDFSLWTNKYKQIISAEWRRVQVPLGHFLSRKPFQLVFEKSAPVGQSSNWFADRIDDVSIRDESCLPQGDCDFEHGLCK